MTVDEQALQVTARAGFAGRARRGTRPALVVVDLCRGFTEPRWATGTDLTAVVQSTAALVRAARALDAPVQLTTIGYGPAELEGDRIAWLRKAPGLRIMQAGAEPTEIDPRLPVEPQDRVITKKGASAFFGTDLAGALTELEVDTVIVCGATTSGCVRATAVDAVQAGFDVLVPRECVGDRATKPHEAALFDVDAKYGDVVTLLEALAYLEGLRESR